MIVDVAVIGTGPAGMSAAIEASSAGLSVAVLDEQSAPGGQIYRGVGRAGPLLKQILGTDYATGASLVEEFLASSTIYLPGAMAWNVAPDRSIDYSRDRRSHCIHASKIIVATGALERPFPIPGWTLPGVVTVGALQILLKQSGIIEKDVALVGSGPLLWLMAAQMVAAGAKPRAVIDTMPRGRKRAALKHLPGAMRGWRYLAKGMGLIARIRAAGVPVFTHATQLHIEGDNAVEAVTFQSQGRAKSLPVQTVALHQGVIPNQQVSRLLRCENIWHTGQQCFHPMLDENFQSSIAGIYFIGDGAGIWGAKSAALAGRLVGLHLAQAMGKPMDERRLHRLRAALAHDRSVRPFLEVLYAPSPEAVSPSDGTIICRCEEVTAGEIREMAQFGTVDPNQIKAFLRTGMGPCQGRVCGPLVTSILGREFGDVRSDMSHFRVRPPLKPISLGELAKNGDHELLWSPENSTSGTASGTTRVEG